MIAAVLSLLLCVPIAALAADIECDSDPCHGTDNNDVITDGNWPTDIYPKEGHDVVGAHGGDDVVHPNRGYDTQRGHDGSDYVGGGENGGSWFEFDYVIGNNGHDEVRDSWGDSAERDSAYGGDGRDIIHVEDGDDYDKYSGGPGDDVYHKDGDDQGVPSDECVEGA